MTTNLSRVTRRQMISAVAAAAAIATNPVLAQTSASQPAWNPSRVVKLVVAYPPGGGADAVARLIAEPLSKILGQPVVVENRAGAGGTVGADSVFKSAPDGHTILLGNADILSVAPNLMKVPFKPEEFVAIGPVALTPFILTGRMGLEAKTVTDIVALSKKKELSFASWGNGSPGHLGAEMFKSRVKTPVLVVPYQGAAPAALAVLADQVDLMFMGLNQWLGMKDKVITYGSATAARLDRHKQIPTMAELGVPVEFGSWQGVVAPPGTPKVIAERLGRAVQQVTSDPEIFRKIEEMGFVPLSSSQEDFAKTLAPDAARWRDIIRAAGIQQQS